MGKKKTQTLKEMRAKEAEEIEQQKAKAQEASNNRPTNALFKTMEETKKRKTASIDEIKEYFLESKSTKQGTFYLEGNLLKALRAKTFLEETSMATVIKELLIEHYFTEDELREAYTKQFKA